MGYQVVYLGPGFTTTFLRISESSSTLLFIVLTKELVNEEALDRLYTTCFDMKLFYRRPLIALCSFVEQELIATSGGNDDDNLADGSHEGVGFEYWD